MYYPGLKNIAASSIRSTTPVNEFVSGIAAESHLLLKIASTIPVTNPWIRKQACFCNAEQSLYICGPVYRNNPLVNTITILGIRDHQSCPVELYLHFGSCYLKYFKCRSINVSSVTKGRLLFLLGNC